MYIETFRGIRGECINEERARTPRLIFAENKKKKNRVANGERSFSPDNKENLAFVLQQ